ncbi:SigE family RNA polymerase sigma factor [Plantactinospora sp. BB1]|uniref:SigE family RNA polymerase sigma factor n=1 Tax=Plantactinospora sp. BB1 TaxID=2071627 RepID=UPI000D16AEAB|nr:SigE family RNA polymerase sigma factor [Plantactinospora sp. BB1]AVT36532.1 SigE family RNA polymerase sigma factor [Plantactinospora sp. BB1]
MTAEEDQDYVEYVSASLGRLRRTAYLLCGDANRADDIVQSTLVSVYLRWSRIRTVDNLDGYVHRILVRRYVDESRRSWARVLLAWRVPELAAEPAGSSEDADAVRAALGTLSRSQRSVLVLRFFCDMSVAETAAVLNCSAGTVKSQTSRGLTAMRDLLRDQWPTSIPGQLQEAGNQ